MATDATGTPTSPDNIPTFNVDVDAPSGLGFNAAMAAIQTALSSRLSTPAGIATGEVPVWNGSTWVRSSATGMAPSGLSGYPNAISKFLRGDGAWGSGMTLLWDSVQAGVTLPAASITTPSLDQSFAHLVVLYEASSNIAGTPLLAMRLNGDSAAHYYGQRLQANNGSVSAPTYTAGTALQIGMLGGTNNLEYRGGGIILLPAYSTTSIAVPITCLSSVFVGSGSSNFFTSVATGMKGDVSATITTLTFLDSGGNNILANSRFSVYGIGGS